MEYANADSYYARTQTLFFLFLKKDKITSLTRVQSWFYKTEERDKVIYYTLEKSMCITLNVNSSGDLQENSPEA